MSGYRSLSDANLVSLLKEGNNEVYAVIYDRFYPLMFIFAYKKLRDEELAKDFVQELFIRLWEKRETIQENRSLSQYLYISLRSRLLDFFAHQKVQHKYFDFLTHYAGGYSNEPTDYSVREKQLAAYIEKQIEKLPSKMKNVFLLSRVEQLSNREIADKLGTTESNVSHHINNALKILKTKLTLMFLIFFI